MSLLDLFVSISIIVSNYLIFHFTVIVFSTGLQRGSVSNARISVKKAGSGERNFRDRRNGQKV